MEKERKKTGTCGYECHAAKDLLHASCGDGCLTQNKSRHHDPLLKLCCDMPAVINCNIDVAKYEVNGACCRFDEV
jgi:hypothetical protein